MRSLYALPALCLSIFLLACGGGGGDKAEPTPAVTATAVGSHPAEVALGQQIQTAQNKQYAGDCAQTDAGRDAGKVCSVFKGERNTQRAYVIGPVASQGTDWVILENRNNQWAVVQTTPINVDTAGVPGVPWPLRAGIEVVVAGADPCLNVREGPALNQKAVDCLANGSKLQIASGPAMGDGISWWQVQGRSGWVSGDYLRYPDAAQ
jgi:hypothetical protein